MIVVIEDLEVLKSLNSELCSIYNSQSRWCMASPNYTSTSFEIFLNDNNNSLYFILNKHEEKIISYIPLYIDNKKTLRFVFDTHTDYCGIIGENVNNNFLKEFAKLIQSNNRINRINFDNLVSDDTLLTRLNYYMKAGVFISSYNTHSYLYSDKEKGYFGTLRGKDRSELKRVAKKNSTTSFFTYNSPENFPLQKIINLRDKMILNGWRDKDFLNDTFLQFIQSLYEVEELIVVTNSIEDEFVSVVFTFKNKKNNSFIFWITLYDQNVQYVNLTSYLNFISFNEFKGDNYYSFGRGDYSFKTTFSPFIENLYNLRYSKSKWDFYFTNYYPLKAFVKRIVKS